MLLNLECFFFKYSKCFYSHVCFHLIGSEEKLIYSIDRFNIHVCFFCYVLCLFLKKKGKEYGFFLCKLIKCQRRSRLRFLEQCTPFKNGCDRYLAHNDHKLNRIHGNEGVGCHSLQPCCIIYVLSPHIQSWLQQCRKRHG